MTVSFDTSELDGLASDLAAAGPKVRAASSSEMTAAAAQLRDDARNAAPVDTGELKSSIHVRGGKGYRDIIADARHAFFVEFGTSDTPPQPYMWPQVPAAEKRLADALEAVADPFD